MPKVFIWHEGSGGICLSISQDKKKIDIYLFVYISAVTLVNIGKNHIPDGSGSGSAIVSHLEILGLAHQPNSEYYLCSTSVTKMLYKSYIVIVQNSLV